VLFSEVSLYELRLKSGGVLLFACIALISCGDPAPKFQAQRVSNPTAGLQTPFVDGLVPGGDRENSYAWCMDVLPDPADPSSEGWLYVGTGRDLILAFAMAAGVSQEQIQPVFKEDLPEATDGRARMYRWKLDGTGDFEEVFRASNLSGALEKLPKEIGFRGCMTYETPDGPALFAVTVEPLGLSPARMLKFEPGAAPDAQPKEVFRVAPWESGTRNSLRPLAVYDGRLLVATQTNELFASENPPEQPEGSDASTEGWSKIADDSDFGGLFESSGFSLWQMVEFNGWLYVILGNPDPVAEKANQGFHMFKGRLAPDAPNASAETGWEWVPIVGSGGKLPAGLGVPAFKAASLAVFKDQVYVGTLTDMLGPWVSGGLNSLTMNMIPPQIYRFDASDQWQLLVGDPDDIFLYRRSDHRAGFYTATDQQIVMPSRYQRANYSLNQYVWWMEVWDGRLFASTFDIKVFLRYLNDSSLQLLGVTQQQYRADIVEAVSLLPMVNQNPEGFDLWTTDDGLTWWPVTVDGFGSPHNYGGRTLKATSQGLFVGTANPFYGAQLWRVNNVD